MPFGDLTIALAVTLLVRVGQMLLISGSVRSKNAAGAAVRLLLDLSVVALALWAVGAIFVPTNLDGSYITWSNFVGISKHSSHAVFILPAILIATAAVHGAAAERTRTAPLLLLAGLMGVVVPLLWQVAVVRCGFPDHAGAGLAVLLGGAMALAAAMVTGPRKGKFNRDQSVNFVPGHNLLLQLVGVMVLVVAFATISGVPSGTLYAVAASTLAAAGFGKVRFGKIDTGLMIAGTMGGLCASAAGISPSWLAVLIGAVVGAVVPWIIILLETRFRVDDVTGSVAPYLVGGTIGILATIFAGLGQTDGLTRWFFFQLALVPVTLLIGCVLSAGVFVLARQFKCLRISEGAEFDGTDLSELDVNAYPDFQQTMIKSYHLREL